MIDSWPLEYTVNGGGSRIPMLRFSRVDDDLETNLSVSAHMFRGPLMVISGMFEASTCSRSTRLVPNNMVRLFNRVLLFLQNRETGKAVLVHAS